MGSINAVALLVISLGVNAQPMSVELEIAYIERDRAYCKGKHPAIDRRACEREQAAVRAALQKGELDHDPEQPRPDHYANRFLRCEVFKDHVDQLDCADRVRSGQVTGSVDAGGIITEFRKLEVIR